MELNVKEPKKISMLISISVYVIINISYTHYIYKVNIISLNNQQTTNIPLPPFHVTFYRAMAGTLMV